MASSSKLLSPIGNSQLFDNLGNPLAGGTITVYRAGTLTLATIYANAAGGALANPVTLNAAGRVPNGQIFLDAGLAYDVEVKQGTTVLESYESIVGLPSVNTGLVGATLVDEFVGDGIKSTFSLSEDPVDINNLSVIVDGLILRKSLDYTQTDTLLSFVVVPASGAQIVVKYPRTFASEVPASAVRNKLVDKFTTVPGTLLYTLSKEPKSVNNLLVALNGLVLTPSSDYTLSGATLSLLVDPGVKDLVVQYNDTLPVMSETTDVLVYPTTGQYLTTYLNNNRVINVKDFGAVGDGVTDDTVAIQNAITATRMQGGNMSKLRFNSGTYRVTTYLTLGSYQYIEFDPGVVINLVPASNIETTSLFSVGPQTSVTLIGNGCILNGTKTGAVTEGNAAAFFLYGTKGVSIRGFNVSNFATDGITLTGDTSTSGPCEKITIQDVNIDGVRRNGISIIHAKGVRIIGGKISNTAGAPSGPWAGIDIEPNAGQTIENVEVIGLSTESNLGGSVVLVPLHAVDSGVGRYEVSILGGRSLTDGDTAGRSAIRIVNGTALANKCLGYVSIRDFVIEKPFCNGVAWKNWDADKAPPCLLQNVTVIDPDGSSVVTDNNYKVAFQIYHMTIDSSPTLGNIKMVDCNAVDTRGGSARMPWGVRLQADTGRQLKNILIKNQTTYGATSVVPVDVLASAEGTALGMSGVDVTNDIPKNADISVTTNLAGYAGRRINITASSTTQTLPVAGNCFGRSIEIQNAAGVASTQIVPATGDTIGWPVGIINTGLVLDEGGFVRLRSLGGTAWEIESLAGRWRQQGQVKAPRTVYNTAAPTTGTWAVGDRTISSAPTVGQPKSWVCTAPGSPGTWVSEGIL